MYQKPTFRCLGLSLYLYMPNFCSRQNLASLAQNPVALQRRLRLLRQCLCDVSLFCIKRVRPFRICVTVYAEPPLSPKPRDPCARACSAAAATRQSRCAQRHWMLTMPQQRQEVFLSSYVLNYTIYYFVMSSTFAASAVAGSEKSAGRPLLWRDRKSSPAG